MIILLVVIGVFIITGVAIISHLAWNGFHRAVGIKPGKMKYISPEQAHLQKYNHFNPQLISINLSQEQVTHLPLYIKQQLQNIDNKACTYQEWHAELENKNATTSHTSENKFVLTKLINQHLPDIVTTYNNICNRKKQAGIKSDSSSSSEGQALSILIDLLNEIEQRLDSLLGECEKIQIDGLKVMERYLKTRD